MKPLASTVKVAAQALLLLGVAGAAQGNPGQFVAKQYTEALGRAPDAGGWQANMNYIAANGCSRTTLNSVSNSIFGSAEYTSRGYDNYEKLLTVYRAIESREPDAGGFNYWLTYLNNGNSLASMVDLFYQSMTATMLAKTCGTLGYGWGVGPTLDNTTIPVNGAGITTLAALKSALTSAASGSTVYLAQRAVIATNEQIRVPSGVTLATMGVPPQSQYAKQARIVRTSAFGTYTGDSALVHLLPGAKLASVWVSGQGQNMPGDPNIGDKVTVFMQGGTGTSVVNSRIDNAAGWTQIVAHHFDGVPCAMTVQSNLLTGYSNNHQGKLTDGISANCEKVTISSNNVVDASDVGVILFASSTVQGPMAQASQVYDNTVVSAGVPAIAALMMDARINTEVSGVQPFSGAVIKSNTFFAAPDSHFDIGLAVGSFPSYLESAANLASNGTFTSNTTGGIATPMQVGISVDGMLNAQVGLNTVTRVAPLTASGTSLPYTYLCSTPGDIVVHNVHATGVIQGPQIIGSNHNCAKH